MELAPGSVPPKIALSYAQQATFQLEAARDTLLKAVDEQPQDALAWARLAELWLALGYRSRALEAAGRAAGVVTGPQPYRNRAGFRRLGGLSSGNRQGSIRASDPARFRRPARALWPGTRRDPAEQSQERAKARSRSRWDWIRTTRCSAPIWARPISRSGQQPALISMFSRRNSRRGIDLAGEQFAIAKELDPKDPTPWFYDAILKQSREPAGGGAARRRGGHPPQRQPRDLSLTRTSRRGPGRARAPVWHESTTIWGSSSWASTRRRNHWPTIRPTSAAHRFLSDIYATQPRREISRVSELLQAQLLQDININPVQPSLCRDQSQIFTGGGPTDAGPWRSSRRCSNAIRRNSTYPVRSATTTQRLAKPSSRGSMTVFGQRRSVSL